MFWCDLNLTMKKENIKFLFGYNSELRWYFEIKKYKDKDYVVFLYPYENDNLAKEMNEVKDLKNVYSLDWKEISTKALEHTKDTHKYRVYKEFYNKYMDI